MIRWSKIHLASEAREPEMHINKEKRATGDRRKWSLYSEDESGHSTLKMKSGHSLKKMETGDWGLMTGHYSHGGLAYPSARGD